MKSRLSDVVKNANTGADAIRRAPIVEEDTGVKCLRIGDVSQNRGIKEWGFTNTSDIDYKRFQLHRGDIIIARTGNTIGVNMFIEKDLKSVFNNGLIRIQCDLEKVRPKFLFYIIKSKKCQDHIQSIAYGTSTQPNMKIKEFLNFEFEYINLLQQEKIEYILNSLDQKISFNNKLNDNLSDLMNCMFHEWFVDHDEMEQKSLYELADFINGTSFKPHEYASEGLPIIKITELKNGITQTTQYFDGNKDKKYYIENGDILFSWSGNPETSIDTFIWHEGNGILNQHTFKVVPKEKEDVYVYLLLKFFKPTFTAIASNKQTTGLGHVTVADLKRLIFYYDKNKVKEFNELVKPIYLKFYNNFIENSKLITLRDTLLPKLMSGEIDLDNSDLKIFS